MGVGDIGRDDSDSPRIPLPAEDHSKKSKSLVALLANLEPLAEDFPPIIELPLDPVDLVEG